MNKAVSTSAAPSAPQFLSQAIVSGNQIFVSGQIHALPDNTLVGSTTADKLSQIIQNIAAILDVADATIADIVKVVIYVTDMSLVPEINETYANYFKEPYPVREAVCVTALPLGASIEISVVAVK